MLGRAEEERGERLHGLLAVMTEFGPQVGCEPGQG